METCKQTTEPNKTAEPRKFPVAFAMLAATLSVVAVLLSFVHSLFLVLYPIAAALLARVLLSADRPILGMVPLLPSVLAVMLIVSVVDVAAIALALCIPMTALVIAVVQRKHLGGFYTAVGASVVQIGLLYAIICLPGILDGTGAFAALQTTMAEIVGFMKEQMTAIAVTAETEATMAQYAKLLDAIVLAIPDMAAGIICLFGSVAGILSVVCFFAFTRKHREALGILAPKPFRLWSIPRAWTKGIMFLYVLAFVLMIADYANAAAVHNTVMQLLSVPLIVQGLAMIAFLLSMRKYPSKSLNAVIFTAIGVLFAIVQSMLTMIGLFEQVLRMRERVIVLRKD